MKRLTKHGNSLALVIDRPILDLLGMDAETPVELVTDGKVLIVAPVRDEEARRRVAASIEKVNRRYRRALERLAR